MYPASFTYVRPADLAAAEAAFREADDPRYLAGGMTLIPTMKQRLAAPSTLIDIARVPGLSFIRREKDTLVIGACTRHATVAAAPEVRAAIPALAALAGGIGDPAVRNRGTIGGSLANNDPAADYPSAVLGLGAVIRTTRRTIAADAFFTGMFSTALEPGEIITEVAFPGPRRAGYAKVRNPASGYAMAGVFVAETGKDVRVAVTGAGACVFRAAEMEQALARSFTPDALADVRVAAADLNADIHGSAAYRAQLVRVMAARAAAAALSGA
ncbi:MAG: xanthine dehydrogenase family protein subunit M [Hyphomonadaceae bacterium]|nr:xanthine dehydrogenase family protein subunit M [Hyphomonadaceae bacterium]